MLPQGAEPASDGPQEESDLEEGGGDVTEESGRPAQPGGTQSLNCQRRRQVPQMMSSENATGES